ncbi:MAG: hypothetical protein V4864_13965 [Pseudomonadota bacterium]
MHRVHQHMARRLAFLLLFLLASGAAWPRGDFGPETCKEGYVWREACGPADKVCVRQPPPDGPREQARADNREARSRVSPTDRRYGPDTCNPGFVWREACGPGDHVCVTPQVRAQAAADNAARGSRLKYPYCQDYAKDAVNANSVNQTYRCGLSGNRWQSSQANHFAWCLSAPDRDTGGERFARYKELDRCSSTAGKTARAGKSFPDAPQQPGGTNKCCISHGPQGAFYTCGPMCP